jgi:AcrR family transcriptional regulator
MAEMKARAKAKKKSRRSQSRKPQHRFPLGRRPGNHPTDETVLDAAEELFAKEGFGVSLRAIANKARVNESLLIHYFSNKKNLIATTFMRRAKVLAHEHIQLLDLLEARAEPPSLEEVVRAWLIPAYNMQRRSAGNAAFLKMSARLEYETSPDNSELRNLVWQGSMQRFITALRRAAPQLDEKAVYWRTIFMIGAFLYTAFENHRISTLSNGLCDPRDADDAIAQFVPFLVGGLQQPS